jgi:outer membrane protein assembly factor BamB
MRIIKLILLFLLLINIIPKAQPFKFGWITDLNISKSNYDKELTFLIKELNKKPDLEFVIISGNITESGKNDELESAKKILSTLNAKYYLIPGINDFRWSESGCSTWKEEWKDNKFNFEYKGIRFIGLSAAVPWLGGTGHISPEDLTWLDNILSGANQQQQIIIVLNIPIDSGIDNWFEITNRLMNRNVIAALAGQSEKNKISNYLGMTNVINHSSINWKGGWEFTVVENRPDTLAFFEITNKDSIPKLWGVLDKLKKNEISKVDSINFINRNATLLWQKELKRTYLVSPIVWEEKIFIASKSGIVTCFDMNGNQLWDYDTYAPVFSRPVIADNVLAVGNLRGDLVTIDPTTGNQIQTIGLDDIISSQLTTIDYEGKKLLMTGKKPKKVIVIGTASGKLLCYDLNSLEPIWENKSASGVIQTRPLYINNKIIFNSWDGYLNCVDARTGALNWKWPGNKIINELPATCSPVTDGKNVFIISPDKYVTAIDLLLGGIVWRKNFTNSWESIGITSDNSILVKSSKDKFFFLSGNNGNIIKEINLDYGEDKISSSLTELNGKIVFGSQNGWVYFINKRYDVSKVLFQGTASILDVQNIKEDIYVSLNLDGVLSVFKLKNEE